MFNKVWLGLDLQNTAISAVVWYRHLGKCRHWQAKQIFITPRQAGRSLWDDPDLIYQSLLQLAQQWNLTQGVKVYLNLPIQKIFEYHFPWDGRTERDWKKRVFSFPDLLHALPWPREETYLDTCLLCEKKRQVRVIGVPKSLVELVTGIMNTLGFKLVLFDLSAHCFPYFKKNTQKHCILWLHLHAESIECVLCYHKKLWDYQRLSHLDFQHITHYLKKTYQDFQFQTVCMVGQGEALSCIRDWARTRAVSCNVWQAPQGLPIGCIKPWALLTRGCAA